jgi:hypothetical protein
MAMNDLKWAGPLNSQADRPGRRPPDTFPSSIKVTALCWLAGILRQRLAARSE